MRTTICNQIINPFSQSQNIYSNIVNKANIKQTCLCHKRREELATYTLVKVITSSKMKLNYRGIFISRLYLQTYRQK